MPKDKKEPGGVYIGLKKAGELGKKLEENKKAKGGLNKFMKERSGAAVTQKEADRLKKRISRSAVAGSVGEAMGASVTDAERERLQDAMPDYADGGEVVFGKGKDYIKDLL
jgi:hypothetical protein